MSKPSAARFWSPDRKKERIDQGKENFSRRKEEHKRFVIEDCNLFLATKIHFFCRLSVMTPTMRSLKVNLVYIVPWQRFSYHLSNL